jgi:hypothetical protein
MRTGKYSAMLAKLRARFGGAIATSRGLGGAAAIASDAAGGGGAAAQPNAMTAEHAAHSAAWLRSARRIERMEFIVGSLTRWP